MGRRAGGRGHGTVALGVLALHALVLWAILQSMRAPPARPAAEPVMTWLSRAASARPATPAVLRAARPPRRPGPPSVRGEAGNPVEPRLRSADAPPSPITLAPSAPAIDWQAAATASAGNVLRSQHDEAQRARASGGRDEGPAKAGAKRESFPWGHEPMGRHYDVHEGILTLRTKRCVVAFALYLPIAGFGCNPGRLDPEPGRGDLFDPRFRAQPLEPPGVLSADPLRPAPPPAR